MLRHLVVLAREGSSLPDRLRFTIDRHVSRGEQIEIVQDRRGATAAPQWPLGRERRRVSSLTEQLRTLGFAIFSREDETATPPPPRPFAPAAAATAAVARDVPRGAPRDFQRDAQRDVPHDTPRAFRTRLSDDPEDDDLDDRIDEDDRNEFLQPRRGGLLVVALVVVTTVAVLTAALVYLSSQPGGRLVAAPPARSRAETPAAPPLVPAPETTTRDGASGMSPTPAPPPSAPAPAASVEPAPTAAPQAPAAAAPAPRGLPPSAAAAPAPAPRELPPSPTLPPRQGAGSSAGESAAAPAQSLVRSQTLPVFPGLPRVEVSRASSPDGTTFTVRLTDPRGRPLPDAQVWVRQRMLDGFVRETRLDPVTPAGSYRGAVPTETRRPEAVTVRFVLGDMRAEMPVTD